MNIVFIDSLKGKSTAVFHKDLIDKIGTGLVFNPEIIDGMGEKNVICNCSSCNGELTKFSEIIIFEYESEEGKKFSHMLTGFSSYSVQSALHYLSQSE